MSQVTEEPQAQQVSVGVFIPSGVPEVDPRLLTDWARVIDDGPFRSLHVADRIGYNNLDPLMVLAQMAAVTHRVVLSTGILLPGLRNPAALAKQVATLARMAPGRVSLGVGVGARSWDYEVAGLPWEARGRLMDEAMAAILALREAPVSEQYNGPQCSDIEILIGGASGPAIRRLLAYGDGYVAGGIRPEIFAFEAAATLGAWQQAGKPGRPRILGGSWVASSTNLDDAAAGFLRSYFRTGGPPVFVNSGIWRGAEGVQAQIEAYAAQGADEVVLFPCVQDIAEIEWLSKVVGDLPPVQVGSPTPVPPSGPPVPPPCVPGTADVQVGGGRPS